MEIYVILKIKGAIMIVNLQEEQINLSKLISLLKNGEDIIIAKAGKPVAKLISYEVKGRREPDKLKGKISFKED